MNNTHDPLVKEFAAHVARLEAIHFQTFEGFEKPGKEADYRIPFEIYFDKIWKDPAARNAALNLIASRAELTRENDLGGLEENVTLASLLAVHQSTGLYHQFPDTLIETHLVSGYSLFDKFKRFSDYPHVVQKVVIFMSFHTKEEKIRDYSFLKDKKIDVKVILTFEELFDVLREYHSESYGRYIDVVEDWLEKPLGKWKSSNELALEKEA